MNNKAKHTMHRPILLRKVRRDIFELLICIALAALFVLLSSGAAFSQGNVGINNAAPHAKSLLDLTSSDKGLLTPRMTAVQRIAMFPVADATAKGMLVYQTDGAQGFYYYDGTAWVMVQSGGAGWSLTGNAGTSVASNFLGTTDNTGLAIRTNNLERMRVTSAGDVAVGNTAPASKLHVTRNPAGYAPYGGAVITAENDGGAYVNLLSANSETGVLFGTGGNAVSGGILYNGGMTPNGLQLRTGGNASRLAIASSGDVTIGTNMLWTGFKLSVLADQALPAMGLHNTNANGWSGMHCINNTNTARAHFGMGNTASAFWPDLGYAGTTTNNAFVLTTNDTERMRIAANGNVGVNNTAPASKLQVTREAAGYAPNPSSALTVEGSGPVYASLLSSNNETGLLFGANSNPQSGGIIYNPGWLPNGMLLRTGGSATQLSISQTGAVTVGNNISWAGYPFGVIAANANSAPVAIRNLDDTGIGGIHYYGSGGSLGGVTGWNNNSNPLAPASLVHGTLANMPATFVTNSLERMRITAGGNVGIGTSNPTYRLQVLADAVDAVGEFRNNNTAGWSGLHFWNSAGSARTHIGFGNAGAAYFANMGYAGTTTVNPFVLTTNNLERVRVAADGNVGIGTSNPTYRLQVLADAVDAAAEFRNSNTAGWSGLHFWNSAGTARTHIGFGNAGAASFANMGYAGTTTANPFVLTTNNLERVRVAADGKVGIGTAAPTTTLEVNGFTKLGTDAPAVKMKKLTGTTGATEGSSVNIAHGLTASKIIGVQVLIEYSAGNWIPNGYTINPEYQVDYVVGATNITLYNQGTNSGNVLSKAVKVLVTYEE